MAPDSHEKSDTVKREEAVLDFWKKNDIFKKSLEKKAPRGDFVFYEGPPTANGRPGIHHLEARAFKDIILRFKTMQGYHVRRKGGWDTHGLPVELQVEKELGLTSKKDIEAYGIAAFNTKCKESVWKYIDEWEKFTDRIGFWLDLKDPYVTYEPNYIESVWNILKTVYDKGLVYKDYKVVPWCPRCGTALSSHELAQGYEDVKDLSLYVKFKVKGEPNTYLVAWTTTPWTLPGNVALAVSKDIVYVKVSAHGEQYILAKDKLNTLPQAGNVTKEMKGSELVGMSYEPLYDFISSKKDVPNIGNGWKVYAADFVTTEEGTGIVHTAVMYGQDDFELGTQVGLPKHHLVSEDGTFTKDAGFLRTAFVKDEATDVAIIKDLAGRELLLKKEKYAHSYPHCWRCKTPLIYYARNSWYIRMSGLQNTLVKENRQIHWEPSHIKEGRFGEWLQDVKDWAISRERYWGTPLPFWKNPKDGSYVVIGSLEGLKKLVKKSGNTYYLMRHGEAVLNANGMILNAELGVENGLTEKGIDQVRRALHELRHANIDYIFYSPLPRTKETARMVAEALRVPESQVIMDIRLLEVTFGEFERKPVGDYHAFFKTGYERLVKAPQGGETWIQVKKRTSQLLYDIEKKYTGKRILIVSHNGVMQMLQAGAASMDHKKTGTCIERDALDLKNAEVKKIDFTPLPHNDEYELDFHRPYIDAIRLEKNGVILERVPEVLDVWFDSGAMPYAQDHYPFENTKYLNPKRRFLLKQKGYPADYITEAIDQTRGWFYTLHAIGVLLGYGRAYKHVICLGHILDDKGKKMSKSLGNIVDPWTIIEKYGADTLRFWMYSVNQPGESKNFDEKTVDDVSKKVFNLLINTARFYNLYKDKNVRAGTGSTHLLDRWILSKLALLTRDVTRDMNAYTILRPARDIKEFIGDLSQWYLRRSRDRCKEESTRMEVLATLRFVLMTLSKLIAPYAPFVAEEIYQDTREESDPVSVHLAPWPQGGTSDTSLLETMRITRDIVSSGLLNRSEARVKVRQPLLSVSIQKDIPEGYKELIKDELNVKNVLVNTKQATLTILDTTVTEELKEEGMYRDFVRSVQDLRKQKNLHPSELATLYVVTDEGGRKHVETWKDDLVRTTSLKEIVFTNALDTADFVVGESTFRIALVT